MNAGKSTRLLAKVSLPEPSRSNTYQEWVPTYFKEIIFQLSRHTRYPRNAQAMSGLDALSGQSLRQVAC